MVENKSHADRQRDNRQQNHLHCSERGVMDLRFGDLVKVRCIDLDDTLAECIFYGPICASDDTPAHVLKQRLLLPELLTDLSPCLCLMPWYFRAQAALLADHCLSR